MSPDVPRLPQICTARSTTRSTASATWTFVIEESRCASAPESSSHAVCQIIVREDCRSIAESAIICWIIPRSASREPKPSRSIARSMAISCARRAMPSQRMQCVSRAGASLTCAYW